MNTDTLLSEAEKLFEELKDAPPVPNNEAPFLQRASLYAELSLKLRRAEFYVKELKSWMDSIEPQLQLDMAQAGMPNCNINGVTIYQKTETWVRKKPEKEGVTTEMICEELCRMGRGDMVGDSYSPASLKSLVTEMMASGVELPEGLARLLDIGSKVGLSTLKVR